MCSRSCEPTSRTVTRSNADTLVRALDSSDEQAALRADERPEGPADAGTDVPYLELRIRARGGDERWVGASLAEVASRRRGTPRIVLVLRDITVAKEMDELKSSLIATVSHELRTPLTSLRALSELLLEHVLAPDQSRELAGHINAEAVRLSRLVDNILDVTRIEAGGLTSEPQRLDLAALLREAVAVVQGQVLEGGPHFRAGAVAASCRRSGLIVTSSAACSTICSATRCATSRPAPVSACRRPWWRPMACRSRWRTWIPASRRRRHGAVRCAGRRGAAVVGRVVR